MRTSSDNKKDLEANKELKPFVFQQPGQEHERPGTKKL